ncbi:NAD-binding protein [Fomitopsis schrenkii]|uniref:NAD-binding protein n=1 Tax=Fomitopsis schrenkii TaxID=2126942 RepID=S8EMQ5_FOMSC|nr:NAD-binding protein [Fomitopsis schrenkii]
MTILITGASGRTSGYVIKTLLATPSPPPLRLFVRSDSAAQTLLAAHAGLGPTNFARGDLLEASTLPPAVAGVDVVFHNAPAFHPNETAMGIALIDAAKAARVKHFVYCSVLHPVLTKLLNHKAKRDVEEYLIESGLNYTILEPASFMQNINLTAAFDSGVVSNGYSPKKLQGFLDLNDLAEVAAKVILDPAPHNRARYELVGENITVEDVARTLSMHLGREIKAERPPREVIISKAMAHVKFSGEYGADALDRMLYYSQGDAHAVVRGIPGSSNVLRWLLGREPTSWEELIRREVNV